MIDTIQTRAVDAFLWGKEVLVREGPTSRKFGGSVLGALDLQLIVRNVFVISRALQTPDDVAAETVQQEFEILFQVFGDLHFLDELHVFDGLFDLLFDPFAAFDLGFLLKNLFLLHQDPDRVHDIRLPNLLGIIVLFLEGEEVVGKAGGNPRWDHELPADIRFLIRDGQPASEGQEGVPEP